MASLTTLVNRMIYWCRDANMGYSQYDRDNFNPAGGNCDCSSLVIHCLKEAGFDTGSASYTGNMSAQLTARGWRRLPASTPKLAGDVLLNDSAHTAVYIGNNQLAQASISENNTISGTVGDQTGMETNISTYYDYPWTCILRYTFDTEEEDDMAYAFLYVSDNFGGVKFFDGTYIHNLTDPDEMKIIQSTYKQVTGKDLPTLKLGEKNAPWNVRFENAIGRRNI